MNLLQITRSLNHKGVELLISGHSFEASKVFQMALQLLTNGVTEEDEDGGGQNNDTVNGFVAELDLSSQNRSVVQDLQVAHEVAAEDEDGGGEENDDKVATFPSLISAVRTAPLSRTSKPTTSLSATTLSVPEVTDEAISQQSSALLFNWALCFHREGMLGNGVSLKKAAYLYVTCLQTLRLNMADTSKQTLNSILTVLALNNQAQIHYELCEYSESCSCMAQVTSMLKRTSNLTLTLKRKMAEEMHINTILSLTAAPAA
jgi:hypothetical protein